MNSALGGGVDLGLAGITRPGLVLFKRCERSQHDAAEELRREATLSRCLRRCQAFPHKPGWYTRTTSGERNRRGGSAPTVEQAVNRVEAWTELPQLRPR